MFLVSVMGGLRTPRGGWRPDRDNYAISLMGGQQIDLTGALLYEGETRLFIFAVMGGSTVRVPRGVEVSVDGVSVMGGRQIDVEPNLERAPWPRLRITAVVAMGGLRVQTVG